MKKYLCHICLEELVQRVDPMPGPRRPRKAMCGIYGDGCGWKGYILDGLPILEAECATCGNTDTPAHSWIYYQGSWFCCKSCRG